MESIFHLFTKEGDLHNKKIFMLLRVLMTVYLATFVFKKFFGPYSLIDPINLDQILEYAISGMARASLFCFGMVWGAFLLFRIILVFFYQFYMLPKLIKKLRVKNLNDEAFQGSVFPVRLFFESMPDYIVSLFRATDLFEQNGEGIILSDLIIEDWEDFINGPHFLVGNLSKFLSFICLVGITFILAADTFHFFNSIQWLIYFVLILMPISYFFIAYLFGHIHAIMPLLRRIPYKSRFEHLKGISSETDIVNEGINKKVSDSTSNSLD
jgi:hypothetical protein